MKRYAATVLSASLAVAAFVWPVPCALFMFVFLIPLFWAFFFASTRASSFFFVSGLLWGLIFFGMTLNGFLVLLHEHAQGDWRHGVYGMLVAYLSLYTALWLYAAHKILLVARKWHLQCALLVAITVCFFFIIEHYALFILGSIQGYPLASPLLPLVEYPFLLAAIPYCSEIFLLTSLITIQAVYAARKNRYALIFALPFAAGIFFPVRHELPEYFHHLGYVCPPQVCPPQVCPPQVGQIQGEHEHPYDVAQEITHALYDLRQRHEEVRVIIMPESSFKFALNEYPRILAAWHDAVLHDDCALIIGSHRSQGENLFNCLYYFNQGLIINHYDKQRCLPFGEHLPWPWSQLHGLKKLFLTTKKEFTGGQGGTVFTLSSGFSCEPCICSEFYLRARLKTTSTGPLLVVSNDSWFGSTPYMQHLFLLLARYRAIVWQRPIIYCAHSGGWWSDRGGEVISLKR